MRVRVGDIWSEEHVLSNGCPQGGVCGSIFYIVAFTKIRIQQDVRLFQYADDSSLCLLANRKDYGTVMNVDDTVLGAAVESFAEQAADVGLQLHPAKTEMVVVNGRDRVVPSISFNFRGVEIVPTPRMRLLGFQVNKEFNIKDFFEPKLKDARRRVWMLRKLQTYTGSKEVLKLVYQVYVRSVLETFLPVTWPSMTPTMIKNAETTQKKCLRIINHNKEDWRDLVDFKKPLEDIRDRWQRLTDKYLLGSLLRPKAIAIWPMPRPLDLCKRIPTPVRQVRVRSTRFQQSPLPYMIKRLSEIYREGNEEKNQLIRSGLVIASIGNRCPHMTDQYFRAIRNDVIATGADLSPENMVQRIEHIVGQYQNGADRVH